MSDLYLDRYKTEELLALVDALQDRLVDLEKQCDATRQQLATAATELMNRSIDRVMN